MPGSACSTKSALVSIDGILDTPSSRRRPRSQFEIALITRVAFGQLEQCHVCRPGQVVPLGYQGAGEGVHEVLRSVPGVPEELKGQVQGRVPRPGHWLGGCLHLRRQGQVLPPRHQGAGESVRQVLQGVPGVPEGREEQVQAHLPGPEHRLRVHLDMAESARCASSTTSSACSSSSLRSTPRASPSSWARPSAQRPWSCTTPRARSAC